MKKQLTSFLAGTLVTTLIFALSISALASVGAFDITVSPIDLLVNGNVFQPKDVNGKDVMVFVYDGTTYAPVRALAEAYGLQVGYDSGKNLATVSQPEVDNTADINIATDPESEFKPVPKLSDMSYEEFKACLTLTMEWGEKLTEPHPLGHGIFYHYHLQVDGQYNKDDFFDEWDAFMRGAGQEYLDTLLQEYAVLAPHNNVVLHIEGNFGRGAGDPRIVTVE